MEFTFSINKKFIFSKNFKKGLSKVKGVTIYNIRRVIDIFLVNIFSTILKFNRTKVVS